MGSYACLLALLLWLLILVLMNKTTNIVEFPIVMSLNQWKKLKSNNVEILDVIQNQWKKLKTNNVEILDVIQNQWNKLMTDIVEKPDLITLNVIDKLRTDSVDKNQCNKLTTDITETPDLITQNQWNKMTTDTVEIPDLIIQNQWNKMTTKIVEITDLIIQNQWNKMTTDIVEIPDLISQNQLNKYQKLRLRQLWLHKDIWHQQYIQIIHSFSKNLLKKTLFVKSYKLLMTIPFKHYNLMRKIHSSKNMYNTSANQFSKKYYHQTFEGSANLKYIYGSEPFKEDEHLLHRQHSHINWLCALILFG